MEPGEAEWRACPSDDELAQWLDRHERADTIDRHLDGCVACRRLVAALSGGDRPGRFGRYELRDVLGAGGMGIVYRAYDPQLQREAAVKRLRADVMGRAHGRLRREARTLARLGHPSIIAVYDVGELDGELFFAMELVHGTTLEQRFAAGPLPWRQALALLLPAGEGLAAAHAAGVVHRDFKPANVMLADDGRVLVMDFGVARVGVDGTLGSTEKRELDGVDVTRSGELLGTPLYMAPEQLAGLAADDRSDQFAFCLVLFEALHGRRPWRASSVAELLEQIRERRPDVLPAPRWLDRAVRRGLDPDPRARHLSMRALIDLLQRRTRRQTWPIVAGVAALLAVMLAVGFGQRDAAPLRTCDALEPNMQGVWNDAVRDRVAGSVAAAMPSGALSSSLATELGAYVTRWDAMRTEACATADVVRIACLRRSRSAVAALVEGLDGADASALSLALDALDELPALERCAGPGLAAIEPAPELVDRVEALRDRLERAELQSDLGRHAAADEAMQEIVDDARALGFEPVLAEALLSAAGPAADASDPSRAIALAEEAFWIAERSHHTAVAAEAALEVVLRLLPSHDSDRVELWLGHAKARIDRGGVDPLLEIALLQLESGLADIEGRTEQALALAEDAHRGYENALGASDRTTVESAVQLGRLQRQLARFDDALATYARVRKLVHERWGPDHVFAAVIANNIGTVLADAGRLDEAVPEFERALQIREAFLGPRHIQVANSLNNVASARHQQGRHAEAVPVLRRALEIWRERLGPDHIIVANGARNLAAALDALGQHEQALEARDEALDVSNETFERDDPRLAIDVCARASTLAHLGRVDEARVELDRCVPILEAGFPAGHPERDAALQRAQEVRSGVQSERR